MSRFATIVALAGVYVGILGLIVAAGASDAARDSGNAVGLAAFVWAIGLIFMLGAYFEAKRTD